MANIREKFIIAANAALATRKYPALMGLNKELSKTEYANTAVTAAAVEHYDISQKTLPEKLLLAFIAGVADYLSSTKKIKDEKKASALILAEDKDSLNNSTNRFLFGAILSYNSTGDDGSGSWNLEFTFDENDIASSERELVKHEATADDFKAVLGMAGLSVAKIKYYESDFMYDVSKICMRALIDVIKAEVEQSEDHSASIEYGEYFAVEAGIEDDELVISMIPGALLKKLIKDDASDQA